MQTGADEKRLVRKLTEGDQMAFELLFYRYRGKVFNFVKSALPRETDAEGIVHEVFMRIWTGRERIDPEQPFGPYLFRTARNLVIDCLRCAADRLTYLSDDQFTADAGTDNPGSAVEERLLDEWFGQALNQLPEQRRKIFVLNRLEGLSYKEIAVRLGITENTVDTQIRRALLFFREEIKKLKLFLFF